jgi:predicted aminopeptidase
MAIIWTITVVVLSLVGVAFVFTSLEISGGLMAKKLSIDERIQKLQAQKERTQKIAQAKAARDAANKTLQLLRKNK